MRLHLCGHWASHLADTPITGTRRHSERQSTDIAKKCALGCCQQRPQPFHPGGGGWKGRWARVPLVLPAPPLPRSARPPATFDHSAPIAPSPFLPGLKTAGARELDMVDRWVEETTSLIYAAIRSMYENYTNKVEALPTWHSAPFHKDIYLNMQIMARSLKLPT